MSLALADLESWLAGEVPAAPIEVNWQPDAPDECVTIATLPGAGGIVFDGAFEVTHVQVRTRSTTDADAEALALQVHAALSSAESSTQMGGTYVLTVEPGAVPAFFTRDVQQRTTYMATYQVTAGS